MVKTWDETAEKLRSGDPAARSARTYVAVLVGLLVLLIGSVVGLNLLLGDPSQGSLEITRAASEWQERTRGVTYPPPITQSRPFKSLRLQDRLPGINGVLLGSSTAMGITGSMFPPGVRVYNFTIAGNSPGGIVSEARHIERQMGGTVKWLFVVLDWSVGGIFLETRSQLAEAARPAFQFHRRIMDTLTPPRVKILGAILLSVLRSPDRVAAFRQAFMQDASDEYVCPDGTPAKDFDIVNRGKCSGFRFDGSWTYYAQDRLQASEIRALVQAALSPSSKYSQYLIAARGEPFRPYLTAIAEIARALRKRGGRLIVILPPLIPGMEKAFLASSKNGPYLERTKAVLQQWARDNDIVVLDAGQAEDYGCVGPEFTDAHHATPDCFAKVMGKFWRDYGQDGLPPGLYHPAAEGR